MASVKNIPDDDNFIRRALPGKHVVRDHDGNVIGFDQALFKYRTDPEFIAQHGKLETSLSINWIEIFAGTPEDQLEQTLQDYQQAMLTQPKPIKLKKCFFTKLNVSEFKKNCLSYKAKPRVICDGNPTKSHGGITQLPQDDQLLLEKLSELAFLSRFEKKF